MRVYVLAFDTCRVETQISKLENGIHVFQTRVRPVSQHKWTHWSSSLIVTIDEDDVETDDKTDNRVSRQRSKDRCECACISACVRESVSMCVRERVCVCMREREREREYVYVCDWKGSGVYF